MTNIEWTDETWNPVRGCTRVSPGCVNCYAERQAIRHAGKGGSYEGLAQIANGHPQWTGKLRMVESALQTPFSWRTPRRVFVNSMSDLFHPDIPRDFLLRVFATMTGCPQHTFQILTKRPEHMLKVMPAIWDIVSGEPLSNVWLGVSVENQKYADERIPLLLQTPAAMRFLSVEPMLEAVDLDAETGNHVHALGCGEFEHKVLPMCRGVDWVICGGESGPGARPFNLAWAESLLAQCKSASVPFFMKQLGSDPVWPNEYWSGLRPPKLRDRKGGDPSEWPESLRVREFPASQKREAVSA